MQAATPISTAEGVLDVISALCLSEPLRPPSAGFLAHHNIYVADDIKRPLHPHRARLNELASQIPSDKQYKLQLPPNMGRWASSGKNMAGILSNHAHEILSYVGKHGNLAKLPDTVRQIVPQPEDKWLAMLDQAIWETSLAWIPEHLMVVGDGCSDYLDQNVVGCMLPIRTTLEADQQLHWCELFCALLLLHRQLQHNRAFGLTVTIVAATTQGHIRVHEASVHKSTTDDSAPTITITKCVDWEITNVDLEDPVVLEEWRNVMSYLCFTSEQNVAFADPGEQLPPLTAAPKRKHDVDIIDPEQENTHVEALDASSKAAVDPADKARPDSLPKTPRKVLAPMNK